MRYLYVLLTAVSFIPCDLFAIESKSVIDLSGEWNVRLDPKNMGEEKLWLHQLEGTTIMLPGIATEVGLGDPLELEPALTKEVFHHLHQRFRYVGPAWYTRQLVLPDDWNGKGATLLLERTIWKTTVWINGKKVGSEHSLSVPHRYEVGRFLKPGTNEIAIRVDNRPYVDIGLTGHAYTDETQTIWNGIIGRIELDMESPIRIARVQITPHPKGEKVPVCIVFENDSGKSCSGELIVQADPINHDGDSLPIFRKMLNVESGEHVAEFDYPLEDATQWSEFDPALYRLTCRFEGAEESVVTGFRRVETKGRELLINGRPSFMRGTLECCIFPKIGYPPMKEAGWDKEFSTVKQYGLNHVRFHSWCPPEAAFASADRHGIYLQVELPNWTFQMGHRPKVDDFLEHEGERIIREYSHHPSFVLLSLGNELGGDYAYLDSMIKHFRDLAPHLLYTSTTFSFSKRGELPGPQDDYFVSQKTKTGYVRGQGFFNEMVPNTTSDYSQGLECLKIPLISHEIGQYCVYPHLSEIPKYDGNLRALNFEAIREDLKKKGRLQEAENYTLNSGRLAALLYKEEIERALRTPGFSGFQLLDLHDFPGQNTATVGLLDAFWDSKGLLAPEDFRRHCAPVVPLLKMPKVAWRNSEVFTAEIEVANFSAEPLTECTLHWKIENEDGDVLAEKTLKGINVPLGNGNTIDSIQMPLTAVQRASKLRVSVTVVGTEFGNDWNFWVYPATAEETPGEVVVTDQLSTELVSALESGRSVLFLPQRDAIVDPLDGRFIPVFWSPVHFSDQPGALGTQIDADNPLFKDFPTSTHTDWQWWELLANSTSVNCDSLDRDFKPIMQFIDKFDRNSLPTILWETQVGRGKLLVCTLDIESQPQTRIVAMQLKRSILDYMNSDDFEPAQATDAKQLQALFKFQP